MKAMFAGAEVFNADISRWQTGSVATFDLTFYRAFKFNCDISKWQTGVPEANHFNHFMLTYVKMRFLSK